jgi:hypothetical protein
MSVFGVDLPATLQALAVLLARAFAADDCVLLLPEEETCYTARHLSDQVMNDLAPLCDTVCQFATTVIAPPRPDRPYRAFFGLPLSHDNALPLAQLLLCRERPVPFGRDALVYLRNLASRLSADLSWRLVHDERWPIATNARRIDRAGVATDRLQEELARGRRSVAASRSAWPSSTSTGSGSSTSETAIQRAIWCSRMSRRWLASRRARRTSSRAMRVTRSPS